MNIFVLDMDPRKAAQAIDCVRLPKMCVESAQMMASALRRWGATDEDMPLTKKGTPYKGGYAHHPCTVWAGHCDDNFQWLSQHVKALCDEYYKRFGKRHACHDPINIMSDLDFIIAEGDLTPFAQAMPDEYKNDDPVVAYRAYYQSKVNSPGGVHYRHTSPPDWWRGVEVTA